MKLYQIIGMTWYGEADTLFEAKMIAAQNLEHDEEEHIDYAPGIYRAEDTESVEIYGKEINRIPKPGAKDFNDSDNLQSLRDQQEHMTPYEILDMLHQELIIRHRDRIERALTEAQRDGASIIAIDRDATVRVLKDAGDALGYIMIQVSPGQTPEQALRDAADKLRDEIMIAMYEDKFEDGYIGTI